MNPLRNGDRVRVANRALEPVLFGMRGTFLRLTLTHQYAEVQPDGGTFLNIDQPLLVHPEALELLKEEET